MSHERKLSLPVESLTPEAANAASRSAGLEAKLAQQTAEAAKLDAELTRVRTDAARLVRELETSRRELQWMLTSTSWRLTRPLRMLAAASPKLTQYGRRLANSLWPRKMSPADRRAGLPENKAHAGAGLPDRDELQSLIRAAAERAADDPRVQPSAPVEGAFLQPFFSSAGFSGPPAITYLTLREAGWAVYATQAEAEEIAGPIRASDLFDAAGYTKRAGNLGALDPALHYVLVGERMGIAPSEAFDPAYYGDRYADDLPGRANRLHHFLTRGRADGRRSLPAAASLKFDRSRLDPKLDTVLLVAHEASRTGAPILTYNLAKRLRGKCNVVALLLADGDIVDDFQASCTAVIGPLSRADWHASEFKHLVRYLLAAYPVTYTIVNSSESSRIIPPLADALVPTVLLAHEFASYVRPRSMMRDGLEYATQVVFSAELVARSACEQHPILEHRPFHILPQGQTERPPARETIAAASRPANLARTFRPAGAENALVVLGCGTVHIRKGVDLFLSCAAAVAAMRPPRPVRFVWVGGGYDPENDVDYSCYLADQIARSGLEATVAFTGEIADVDAAYALSDVFFLSSRLDPLPNSAIDAAMHGLPVICFDRTSGIADILRADPSTRECVVPHLDVRAAAELIVTLAGDEAKRRRLGNGIRNVGGAAFDMDRYVSRLGELGAEAAAMMRQRAEDLATLRADAMFDPDIYLPAGADRSARSEAIVDYLTRWAAIATAPNPDDYALRRPCPGFHPQIYAHAHAGGYDTRMLNPLAHFIRSGKPDGPWRHEVVTPESLAALPPKGQIPPAALHAHFHYPELAEDFAQKLAANGTRCDLLLSTDENGKARTLRRATAQYRNGEVDIRVVPNRGRDIGAFLTAFGEDIARRYVIVGHVHGKRSPTIGGQGDPTLGDRWREFLWQNLLGDHHAMMDGIIAHLAADETLGLVFPEDPHLCDWRANRANAQRLAARMGMKEPLPPFFDFPIGTMFWARTAALTPLLELKLGWEDYPSEPVPYDGTVLHAIERLLPFVAQHAGYRFATTHFPGVTW
ncbi:MAG: glycosyltransferase [Hyphomicrobiales bacterium]|nr:glycosyltransferase [Hyphomicrobiales bacterium]MBV8825575.1 glycosyltransferase [Hyphomicrobiales bacterium]MBV9430104.1 glycosyltransferase [Bradyrhizobiaceae bacterium]